MHIFIDESGPFIIPLGREWLVSCVGTLVFRDNDVDEIFAGFKQVKDGWGVKGQEIKGSQLNENQVAELIRFLSPYDVIFDVTAIDMVMQTPSSITEHRLRQADKIVERLTEEYHEDVKRGILDLRERLRELSNQLYVQAICSFELLYRTIQKATSYYVQRYPEELSEFYWQIDAKHENITPYEYMWLKLIMPIMQSKSFGNPFIILDWADYSYFEKYFKESPAPPAHLADFVDDTKPFKYIATNNIFQKNLSFIKSHDSLGLQIADILITNIRRAMNGNLQANGWSGIGRLMVQSDKDSQLIQIIDLSGELPPKYRSNKPPYWQIVPLVEKTCKPMLKR